jgi:hypothetical protein
VIEILDTAESRKKRLPHGAKPSFDLRPTLWTVGPAVNELDSKPAAEVKKKSAAEYLPIVEI